MNKEKDKKIIKKLKMHEDDSLMLLGESSLKKTWDNKYDTMWDAYSKEEINRMLKKTREHAKKIGLKPEDIEEAIKRARSKKN